MWIATGNMIKRLSFSMFACVALAILTPAQTNTTGVKKARAAETTRIEAYCQGLDAYAKNNPIVKLIAAVSRSENPKEEEAGRGISSRFLPALPNGQSFAFLLNAGQAGRKIK